MEWFFNGLGTEIIVLIIGLLGGGFAGYKIGIKKNLISQKQEAKENAEQNQKSSLNITNKKVCSAKSEIEINNLSQKQSAGNNAAQTQIGEINHE